MQLRMVGGHATACDQRMCNQMTIFKEKNKLHRNDRYAIVCDQWTCDWHVYNQWHHFFKQKKLSCTLTLDMQLRMARVHANVCARRVCKLSGIIFLEKYPKHHYLEKSNTNPKRKNRIERRTESRKTKVKNSKINSHIGSPKHPGPRPTCTLVMPGCWGRL